MYYHPISDGDGTAQHMIPTYSDLWEAW